MGEYMRIFVNEAPKEPKECLFVKKITDTELDLYTGKYTYIDRYYCNVNMKHCDMDCGRNCDKLVVLDVIY